jgi:hypothetical protein
MVRDVRRAANASSTTAAMYVTDVAMETVPALGIETEQGYLEMK